MIMLYNIPVSGNCHKIRLLLSFLDIDCQTYDLNLAALEQKSDEYLQLNPFGQAPVLVDGEITIRDSQAILVYLASHYGSTDWWTDDPEQLAHITEWLSTAANEIAHGPALMRAHYKFGRKIDLEHTQTVIEKVLSIIDQHLHSSAWLVGSNPSIADIAIYPYLALAHEGHIDLNPYTHILEWMARFESLPHFIAMPGIQLNH